MNDIASTRTARAVIRFATGDHDRDLLLDVLGLTYEDADPGPITAAANTRVQEPKAGAETLTDTTPEARRRATRTNGESGRPRLPRRNVAEKTCSQCGQTKPASGFQQESRTPTGLTYACRECLNRPRSTEPVTTKLCTSCNVTKAAAEFLPDRRKKDGLGSWCRVCFNDRRRKTERRRKAVPA